MAFGEVLSSQSCCYLLICLGYAFDPATRNGDFRTFRRGSENRLVSSKAFGCIRLDIVSGDVDMVLMGGISILWWVTVG